MQLTSILAIYALIWVITAFVSLPFGVKTHDELGLDKTPGQADSAPANFRPGRLVIRASIIAAAMTGLFVLNYSYEWIGQDDFDFLPSPPPGEPQRP